MDYIFEEGTLERKQEEGLYDLIFRNENFFRIRNRLKTENLISQEEEIVLEKILAVIIALIIKDASLLSISDRVMEYSKALIETRD